MIKNLLHILLLVILLNSCGYKNIFKKFNTDTNKQEEIPSSFEQLSVEGMAYIPGGWFNIGSSKKPNERPVHRIHVDGFYMDENEVTVAEFYEFCMATHRAMPSQPDWNMDNHPVVNVTWRDAAEYAAWAGKRLPTEAEWEFAARGGGKENNFASESNDHYVRNFGNIADESIKRVKYFYPIVESYDDGYIYTSPAGSFAPNMFGLMDMKGNVLEWCADWYDQNYYKRNDQLNPKGPETGKFKSLRGASWNRSGKYLRVTYRSFYHPTCRFNFLGFRCVMDGNTVPMDVPMDKSSILTKK